MTECSSMCGCSTAVRNGWGNDAANLEIKVTGDVATARATFIAQHMRDGADGGGQSLLGGKYTDTLRRTEVGWKIVRRHIRGIWSDGDPSVLTMAVA